MELKFFCNKSCNVSSKFSSYSPKDINHARVSSIQTQAPAMEKTLTTIIIIIIVEPEMYDHTSNGWSHWNSSEKLKEKFGSCTRKTFDRFTTKDSYTWNITHNTESTAV